MKEIYRFFFLVLLTFFFTSLCYSKTQKRIKDIVVVNAKYDKIEKILDKYRIPYKIYNYRDLETDEIYNRHRAIFFPCGVKKLIETNVNILSRGTSIQSVSLKKDFLDINEDKIIKNIKTFIENGGTTYFSGYSYELIDLNASSISS